MRIIIVLIIQIFLITSLDISDVFALAPSSEVILLGASVSQEGVDIKIEPQFEKSEDSSSNLVEKYLIKTQSSYFLLQDMADIKNEELIELIKNLILFFKDKDWRMPGIFKLSADVVWLYLERKPKIVGEDVFIELIKTVNQKIYLIKESMIKEEKTVIEDIFMHHIIIYLNKKMENKGKFEELLIIKIKELNKICLETEGNEVFNGFVIERISRFYTMQPEKSLDKLFQFMKQGSLEIKEKSGMKVCFVLKRYKLKESTLKKIYKVCSTLKNKDLEIMAEFILGLTQENRKMQQDNEEISEFEVYFDSFLPYKRKALVDRNKDKALKISQKREDFSNKQNLIYKIFIILEICLFIIIVLMYSTSIVVVYFCLGVAYSLIIIYGIICAWCYYFNNKLEKLDEYFIFTEHTKGFFNRIKKIDFGNNRQKQKLLADIVKYLHEQIQEYPKYTDLEKKSSKKGELLIKIKELQLLCLFILYLSSEEPILTLSQLNKIVYSDVFLIKSNPEETFINSGLFEYNFEYGDSIYAILGQIAHKTGAVIVKEGSLGKGLMLTGLFKNVISNISVLVVLDKLVAVEEEKSIQDLIKESFDESFFSFGWTLSNIHTVYLQRVKDKGDNVFSLMIIQLLSEEFFRRLYKDEDILKLLLSFLEKGSLEIKKASIDLICKLLIEYRLKQTQLELINNLEDFLFLESDEDLEDKRRFIIECLIPENSQPKRRLPTKNINVFLKEKFDFYKRSSILDRDSYKTKKQDLARRLKNQKQIEIYENQVLEHKRQRNKIYNKVKYIFIWTGIISFMVSITSIIFHMGNIVIWSCVGVAVVGIVIFFIYYIYSNWRLKKIKTLIKNFKASDRYFIFTKHTRTFFNRIKELDFSNERQKQQLLSDIVKYLNKQTKKYPTYEELERKLSKTGKLLIKIKEFHLLCLFILYLSAKESILTHEQLDKLINFDVFIDEEEYRASHVWDLGFKYSLKELEERNLIDVILGTIAHETGHSIFAEKCITYQELESRSFSEAFADISRFVVFEKLTEVRKEKTVYDLIKNCRSFIYDKVFSEYSVFNLELHWPIVVNNKSSKLSSLKKKGFIKIIKDIESGKFKIIWNKNSYKKAEFITAFGGEQGKEFYKIYLCNSYFVSAEEHYVARITLYKIMEFFNNTYCVFR